MQIKIIRLKYKKLTNLFSPVKSGLHRGLIFIFQYIKNIEKTLATNKLENDFDDI